MVEVIQAWQIETDNWLLVEYEKQPQLLLVSLCHKQSEDFYSFGSLGIDRYKLESADKNILDTAFYILSNYADAYGANTSFSSLWDNLIYAMPDEEDTEDWEPEAIALLESVRNLQE